MIVVQLVGSVLVLAAYLCALTGRLDQRSYTYLAVNAVATGALATSAATAAQWGFLLLEGVWSIASSAALVRRRVGTG